MKLHVEWLKDARFVDGGCWVLCSSNGHLVATMAVLGKNKRAHETAEKIAASFNIGEEIAALKVLATA